MTREVEARLKISAVDRTGSVLKNVGNRLREVNKRVEAMNKMQQSSLMMMGRLLGPTALAYGLKESVVAFADLERQMTRIGITADASAEQTRAAFDAMQQQAKEMALPLDQAIKALDTLVSSGMNLKDAMAFMPSILATAQASGADTADIANTAIKAASALKLEATEMQRAFDIMVAGGKAGQFELKDMAQYIPDLANSFASLGYQGEDGLKKLIALLQTVREDTGSSEAAATNLGNVLGKIYSEDTAGKFKKMGVDLNAELAKAKKNGEDTVAAFVRISNEAIKGDLTKLPRLFTDQQFRLGMQSLMTSQQSYEKFLKTVNDSKIDGTVFRDLERVTSDAQASVDRLSSSWDRMMKSIGGSAAEIAVPLMDKVSEDTDKESAALKGFKMQGNSTGWAWWKMLNNMPIGFQPGSDDYDRAARLGGYVPSGRPYLKALQKNAPFAYEMLGRYPRRPVTDTRHAAGARLNAALDDPTVSDAVARSVRRKDLWRHDRRRGLLQDARDQEAEAPFSLLKSMKMGMDVGVFKDAGDQVKQGAEEGGQKLSQGGEDAAQAMRQAAQDIRSAGQDLKATLGSVNFNVNTNGSKVNANVGRTDTFARAPGTGRQ